MASQHSEMPPLQVGTYFVRQYYQVLQQQPEYVHQFYNDISVMQRVDVNSHEIATGMMEIHKCVMSLNYTSSVIEIKSADAQNSLGNGILVMVTGTIQRKDVDFRKNFVQTFFLAPQDNGYYVRNDIFRYIEDSSYQQSQGEHTANGDSDSYLKSPPVPDPEPEPASPIAEVQREMANIVPDEEASGEEYENVDHQEISVMENQFDQIPTEVPVVVTQSVIPPEPSEAPLTVEENIGEPAKHTYASIVRASKGASAATQSHQITPARMVATTPERYPLSHPSQPHVHSSAPTDEAQHNLTDDPAGAESEGDVRSVYIGNLPSTVASSDLEQEFKKFGKIKSGGVTVVSRKDSGFCYAFIDFEDSSSVQNAVAASPIAFGGKQIHVEEKRNTSSGPRGRRGGRGRTFQGEGARGRAFGVRGYVRSGADAGRSYSNSGRGSGGRGSFGSGGNARQPRRAGVSQLLQNGAD